MREDPQVVEYVLTDIPDCLPVGDVAFIEQEILKCRDADYRRALVERQAAWYQSQMAGKN